MRPYWQLSLILNSQAAAGHADADAADAAAATAAVCGGGGAAGDAARRADAAPNRREDSDAGRIAIG